MTKQLRRGSLLRQPASTLAGGEQPKADPSISYTCDDQRTVATKTCVVCTPQSPWIADVCFAAADGC